MEKLPVPLAAKPLADHFCFCLPSYPPRQGLEKLSQCGIKGMLRPWHHQSQWIQELRWPRESKQRSLGCRLPRLLLDGLDGQLLPRLPGHQALVEDVWVVSDADLCAHVGEHLTDIGVGCPNLLHGWAMLQQCPVYVRLHSLS